ncbi:MAG: hypothetical protein R3B96_07320 [Pirellulaceae bacterium]
MSRECTRLSDIEPPPDEPGHWVNLEIDETLKMSLQEGPHEQLGMFLKRDLEELEHWIDESMPLLIAYDNTQPYQAQVITLEPDKVEVMNRDFEVLRDAEEVIRVAPHDPPNSTQRHSSRDFSPLRAAGAMSRHAVGLVSRHGRTDAAARASGRAPREEGDQDGRVQRHL